MKAYRNVVMTIAAFAFAGIIAGTAKAQDAMVNDAHFTLPFQATWADTVLPPGDYSLSVVRRDADRLYTVTFAGAGKKKTILALRPLGPHVGATSTLVAVSRGETYSIRALHLHSANLVLTFPESKAERELVAKARETLQRVPILIAQK